jgi:Uma2 family endonuclease
MVVVLNEDERVEVPGWVVDLASFRRWTESDEAPDKSRLWFLGGEVWVDMSMEQVFSHNQVKTEFTIVTGRLVEAERMGLYVAGGLYLTSRHAGISGQPDGTFLSNETIDRKRAQFRPGTRGGFVEVEGDPDMVLEVVSDSSVEKDTVVLRKAYWEAGIKEYWLVDARKEPIQFDILRHTAKGYAVTRKTDGWLKSAVFQRSFRLTTTTGRHSYPEFRVEVR